MISKFFNKYRKKIFITVGFFFILNIFYHTVIPLISNEAENIKLPKNIMEIRKFDIVLGDSKAKNKILMYADCGCHACVFTYNNNIEEIKRLINNSKLQFIYRPTPMSRNSILLLNFIFMKNFPEDDKFKALSLIYSNIKVLYDENFKKEFKEIFKRNGLNIEEYDKLVNVTKSDVMKNVQNAMNDGIKSTPTIIINGKAINIENLKIELKRIDKM